MSRVWIAALLLVGVSCGGEASPGPAAGSATSSPGSGSGASGGAPATGSSADDSSSGAETIASDTTQDPDTTASAPDTTSSDTGAASSSSTGSPADFDVLEEVLIEADGDAGNTYALFTDPLGGSCLEVPDLYDNNHPGVPHIAEQLGGPSRAFFRFTIHRDIDRDRGLFPANADRQRNEIKANDGSDPATHGLQGETVRYHWFFRLADDIPVTPLFSHFMQIKAFDADGGGLPILTVSGYARNGGDMLEVRHSPATGTNTTALAEASWAEARGQWLEAEVIATYADEGALRVRIADEQGALLVDVDLDDIDMWRDAAEFNRPKWGIYRSIDQPDNLTNEEDVVDFADFRIQKIVLH